MVTKGMGKKLVTTLILLVGKFGERKVIVNEKAEGIWEKAIDLTDRQRRRETSFLITEFWSDKRLMQIRNYALVAIVAKFPLQSYICFQI